MHKRSDDILNNEENKSRRVKLLCIMYKCIFDHVPSIFGEHITKIQIADDSYCGDKIRGLHRAEYTVLISSFYCFSRRIKGSFCMELDVSCVDLCMRPYIMLVFRCCCRVTLASKDFKYYFKKLIRYCL